MKINIRLLFIYTPLLVMLLLLFGFFKFLSFINQYNTDKRSSSENIKGIAVLAGGWGRIDKGLRVFNDNENAKLILSGVSKNFSLKKQKPFEKNTKNNLVIDNHSRSTLENAIEISNWAKKLNINKINVITSYYHIPRSLLLLKYYSPNIDFIANPVFKNNYEDKAIRKIIGNGTFLFEEYIKFVFTYIFVKIL